MNEDFKVRSVLYIYIYIYNKELKNEQSIQIGLRKRQKTIKNKTTLSQFARVCACVCVYVRVYVRVCFSIFTNLTHPNFQQYGLLHVHVP
jgi:hypothetical protein